MISSPELEKFRDCTLVPFETDKNLEFPATGDGSEVKVTVRLRLMLRNDDPAI